MHRTLAVVSLIVLAGCIEPPKTNRAIVYVTGLVDLSRWDPINGGRGQDAYDALLQLEPKDSVPVLIESLLDPTPTGIYDKLHRPATVGDVAFHMLCLIFQKKPADFDREGVWISQRDPVRNPIYTVRLDVADTRQKVRVRFTEMAIKKDWYPTGSE